jgi:hypothetical protein
MVGAGSRLYLTGALQVIKRCVRRTLQGFVDFTEPATDNLSFKERRMEDQLKQLDIDKLPLPKLVEALRQAAKSCQCEGTRETIFSARGRDNVVNCLECEPIYNVLEPLEKALAMLQTAK